MASANAQIGEAYAAYFPTFKLSSDAGFQSQHFSNLFHSSNRTWSIGPSVSETIFDAGLRTATVHQFIATYNSDLYAYRQTVLTAFQQTEDALAEIRLYSKQLREQRDAEKSAEEFLTLEMSRYQTGIDPYVDVVTAQTTLLTDQQAVITVQVLQMTSAVALVEALGGGWDVSHLPTPPRSPSGRPTRKVQFSNSLIFRARARRLESGVRCGVDFLRTSVAAPSRKMPW